ncbi:cholesterol 7-desaturase nvd-like [Gigantopelta aegis]|uniref:cholesterol 7-desaturase nvd-like n=1 Tax=Gigantopelta aegis TaxID=1735272 RepID=UPI001B88DF2D|nr:cholesterol 7-desaturase nvd-like [Gigantopelta aegis]
MTGLEVGVFVSLLISTVSASVTEKILITPLFEIGELWINASSMLFGRVTTLLTSVPNPYNVTTYVGVVIACLVIYYGYVLFFVPLNRVRKLGDIGYVNEGSWNKREIANMVRQRRKVGAIPPVYPNGWFPVMEAFTLKTGEVKNVSILGLALAVFRDEKGFAHALDAYCPHMGANMAAGGRVCGDSLECPFHAWKFRGEDGKCTSIPYAEKIPDIAKVKSWPILERNRWLYLWFHAEGVEPFWMPPEIEEITRGEWTYRGRSEHIINAHIEEIPENGADVVHLSQVHGPVIGAGIDLRYMWSELWAFARHSWDAKWEAAPPPDGHIGKITLKHSMSLFGKRFPPIDLTVHGQQIGPGIVYLRFTSWFGNGVYIQSLTPIEPMVQKLVHNIYVTKYMPMCVAKFLMLGEAIQVERDVMIWNNKQYCAKPVLVKSKEDSLIARHRRWYSQFYSENSPQLTFKQETLEW